MLPISNPANSVTNPDQAGQSGPALRPFFDALLDATTILNNVPASQALSRMWSTYEQNLYFVAFVGQYSAGKSCLLNNLIGRPLLPQGRTETTPILTYIRYGEQEQAKLHYQSGEVQTLPLSDIPQLTQKGHADQWTPEQLADLDYLEIFLPDELLAAGMILLDTPGINTLVERHEQLLANSLSLASGIVYVASGSPSQVDTEKLRTLTKGGFSVTFVRTHCDQIRTDEESLDQVKEADYAILKDCGVPPDSCYFLSNLSTSPHFAALEPLRRQLIQQGKQAHQELEAATRQQLTAFARQCTAELQAKQRVLSEAEAKNTNAIEQRQQALFEQMQRLEQRIEESEEAVRQRVNASLRRLNGDVSRQLEQSIERTACRIETDITVTNSQGMNQLLRKEVTRFAQEAYCMLNNALDPLVQEINGELHMEAEKLSGATGVDGNGINGIELPQADSYLAVCAEQDESVVQLREQLTAIRANQAEVEQALQSKIDSPAYQQLQDELFQLEQDLAQVNQKRDGMAYYIPKMIPYYDGRMQPSDVARSVGRLADLALLVLPGSAIEKGISQLPKIGGKLVQVLGGAKVFSKLDTARDIAYAGRSIFKGFAADDAKNGRMSRKERKLAKKQQRQQEKTLETVARGIGAGHDMLNSAKQNSDPGTFLEWLTVEHWAVKLGQCFDKPPQLVVDKEDEELFRQEKQALEQQQRELNQNRYQKLQELGLLENEEQRLRAQQESLRIDEAEIEREMKKREAQIRAASERAALKAWKQTCSTWYREQMTNQLHNAIQSYKAAIPERLAEYQRRHLQQLRDKLEAQRASYETLLHTPPDAITVEKQRITNLLQQLSRIGDT